MQLFRTKVWNWRDIALLKWCCLLYGVAAGAYFHQFVAPHLWLVLATAVLLTIRPTIAYWKD